MEVISAARIKHLALQSGFDLAGVARAEELPEAEYFDRWVGDGMAGEMSYLTDHRAALRHDPRTLLASARSVLVVGKLYHSEGPLSTAGRSADRGWISRYAWGTADYHDVLRDCLERTVSRVRAEIGSAFEYRICVDTAPVLERALGYRAGLGWRAKNTCLINQEVGSYFFLGELVLSLDLEPDQPPPDRCGTCCACIDACPTQALVPTGTPDGEGPAWALDSRRCISYLTIELRGPVPEDLRARAGWHVFGCDICQDVCPWNGRAPFSEEPGFQPSVPAPKLSELASLSEQEFRTQFRATPVSRTKYRGFLRNVALAMGNSGNASFRDPLERLLASADPMVAAQAEWSLDRLNAQEEIG